VSPAELLKLKRHDPVSIGPEKALGYIHRIQENGARATVRRVLFNGNDWFECRDAADLDFDGAYYANKVLQEVLRDEDGTPTARDLDGWVQ
jgi:hypothetical protein